MTPSSKKVFGVHQQPLCPEKAEKFLRELCARVPRSIAELERRKREFSAREKVSTLLNRDLIAVAKDKKISLPPALQKLIQKRAVRTISGVTPIGVLTKQWPCPGQCVYCPTEARMPKSYLSSQPAAARALRHKFHPFDQVQSRISAVEESGHPVSKLELIVMGGTWSFLPHRYQTWFIKQCFDAANGFPSKNLVEAQKRNETAERRIIGVTLETRPDFITEDELVRMRRLGCTRIEIGVQTIDDEVSRLTKRGHGRADVARATKLMRDFGFKICYHLMPGLPGSTSEKDLKMLTEVFENPDFRPDFVKIYPCQVLEGSELRKWWEKGKFIPLHDEDLVKLLLKFKKIVPPWVRIMRLLRDIPVGEILDGAQFSNLRQILQSQPKKLQEIFGSGIVPEWPCQCIRCREVGFQKSFSKEKPILVRRDYDASGGKEIFLSFESPDKRTLYSLLRLRIPSGEMFSHFASALKNAALIREVHSYGGEVSVGDDAGEGQHRGLGKLLIAEAERITREEFHLPKISVIAGVGTREYYRKFGYELKSTYLVKKF